MKKRLLFIFNPKSGKAQIKNKLYEIIDTFVKGGYEVVAHPTQGIGDAHEKTKELAPGRGRKTLHAACAVVNYIAWNVHEKI